MRIAFFSALLLALRVAQAATPIDGWYASVFGGYSYLPDNISRHFKGTAFTRASYENGYHAGGRLGFQNDPLRYEGELTYVSATVKSFRANQRMNRFIQHPFRNTGGQSEIALGMANLYYDFPEMVPCIAPYLGVGLGYAWVETTLNDRRHFFNNSHAFHHLHFRGSDSAFAYQATAGFTFNFAENYALNIAYRYVGTNHVNNLGKMVQANLGSLGVVYRFDESNYK